MSGRVKFSMIYQFQEQNLTITIFEANDLPSADEDGASDPYIRVMLLPDTKRRYETVVSYCYLSLLLSLPIVLRTMELLFLTPEMTLDLIGYMDSDLDNCCEIMKYCRPILTK